MDGLSWKTLLKWMIWGVPTIFGNIHFPTKKTGWLIGILSIYMVYEIFLPHILGGRYTPLYTL